MKSIIGVIFFFFFCHFSFGLKPERNYARVPSDVHLDYLSYTLPTFDNAKIKAWVILPVEQDNKKCVILSNGDSGNMAQWIDLAKLYHQKGYTVVMYDYRGFGRSSDFTMDQDRLYYDEFVTDFITVVAWVREHVYCQDLGSHSFSMGTIINQLALQRIQLDFSIYDSPVFDPMAVAHGLARIKKTDITTPSTAIDFAAKSLTLFSSALFFIGKTDVLNEFQKIPEIPESSKIVDVDCGHLFAMSTLSNDFFADAYFEQCHNFISNLSNY